MLTVLGGRLAWLQLAEGQRYKTLAEQNRINVKLLAPSRGLIVDRYGTPIAVNNQNFRVLVIPEQTQNLEQSLISLQKLITLSDNEIQAVLKQAEKTPKFAPLEVRDTLTWDEVATVEVNLPDLPGLSIDVGEIRFYPMGGATAHLIGYVGSVSKGELTDNDPLLKIPGFRIGKTGLEKVYDQNLRGRAGAAEVEVNVVGREVRELSRNPGEPGQNLTLTIDAELQRYMQDRMVEAKSASAVIMDVHTGAVYGMASTPSFDPNIFTRGLTPEEWEGLLSQPGHPLNNKAAGGLYPPGSTFKMVTAMAALELGIINQNKTFFCPGHFELGDTRFHCWRPSGHGHVNVIEALAQSCDTFFYNVAVDIGIDRLAEMSRRLGFGQILGIELTEERPGLIPTKDWKRSHMGKTWQPGESVVASIGQGYTQTTPLQLAVMTARLVNGGMAVKPWLAEYAGNARPRDTRWPSLGLKKQNLDLVIQGMINAVNAPRGTALGSKISIEGMEMGGKTGTAQVKRITADERARGVKNETLPWHLRHHALFVGFAPIAAPRYCCAVVVEHGVGGAAAAAPIGKDIMLMAQQRDPASKPALTPTGTTDADKANARLKPDIPAAGPAGKD
ncbi:MAG TPA: penicillin-binding protein 2 [Micavibrio sp.]|jgi:penicillin-binding protein 2